MPNHNPHNQFQSKFPELDRAQDSIMDIICESQDVDRLTSYLDEIDKEKDLMRAQRLADKKQEAECLATLKKIKEHRDYDIVREAELNQYEDAARLRIHELAFKVSDNAKTANGAIEDYKHGGKIVNIAINM